MNHTTLHFSPSPLLATAFTFRERENAPTIAWDLRDRARSPADWAALAAWEAEAQERARTATGERRAWERLLSPEEAALVAAAWEAWERGE